MKKQPQSLTHFPDLISVKQAQEVLGVDRHTIYDNIRAGSLCAFKLGHTYKITKASLLAFTASEREGGTES